LPSEGGLLAIQNNAIVTISVAVWEYQASLALILLLSLAAGAFITALISTPGTLRMQWRIRRQQAQIERLKTERAVLQERLQLLEQQAHVPQALPPDSVLLD